MRRKSNTQQDHFRSTPLRHDQRVANFQQQMTEFARGGVFLRLRKDRRLSQETAAAEVGVTARTWREWETKDGPIKVENLEKVARVFDVAEKDSLVTRDVQGLDPMQLDRIESNQQLILRLLHDYLGEELEQELDDEIQRALQPKLQTSATADGSDPAAPRS